VYIRNAGFSCFLWVGDRFYNSEILTIPRR